MVGQAGDVGLPHDVAHGAGCARPARHPRDVAVGHDASGRNAAENREHTPGEPCHRPTAAQAAANARSTSLPAPYKSIAACSVAHFAISFVAFDGRSEVKARYVARSILSLESAPADWSAVTPRTASVKTCVRSRELAETSSAAARPASWAYRFADSAMISENDSFNEPDSLR